MGTDLRYAVRALAAAPGFAAAAILTLALGIGANTAIFSVAWQALLKPLPFPAEDRLAVVRQTYGPNRRSNPIAPANLVDWRTGSRTFEAIAGFSQYTSEANLTGQGEPQTLEVGNVTPDLFTVLGMKPVLGRVLVPSDAIGEGASAIVLVESVWHAKFGADPAVIGRTVSLNGEPIDIVGVVPDAITIGTVDAEAFAPFSLAGEVGTGRQAFYMGAIGRLRQGVTLAQANSDVQAISARAAAEYPKTNRDLSAAVSSFRATLSLPIRPAILVLACAASLVLLIACANLAGLQLARHARREREIAVRAAIGATRFRIARALAIEGLLVATAGGYVGLTLGMWALATLQHFAPPAITRDVVARPDFVVLEYTLALSVASGLAFSVWPGWRAAARPLAGTLAGRGIAGDRAGTRIRMVLVSAEVALAVVVLAGAALLLTSLANVLRVNPGFEFNRGLVVDVNLPDKDYPTLESQVQFFDRVTTAVAGMAGVEGACMINQAPLAGQKGGMTYVVDGETRFVGALPSTISPSCIALLRVPLLRGRVFSPREVGSPVLVSASMARDLFKGADPIGRRIHMGLPNGPLLTVVGVVGDIRSSALESSYANHVWMDYTDPRFTPRQLLVRTSTDPGSLTAAVRERVRAIDPKLPVTNITTMADLRADQVAGRRFSLQLLLEFAAVALVICSLGIYGLLTEITGHRTREIGVRLALGARPADVVRGVVGGTAKAVLAGTTAGTVMAVLLSRFVKSLLFGVSATEPAVYAAIVGLVAAVALLAAWLPARRATRLDPLVALRVE
jgi:putative ABC transport system permease protein